MPSPAAGSAPLACRYRVGYPGPTRACGAAPAVFWARTTLRRAGLPRVTPGPYCERHHPERLAREEAARRAKRAAKRETAGAAA